MKLRQALLPIALIAAMPLAAHAQRGFTVNDMVKLDRYSSPLLAADGKSVLYARRTVDANLKANTALWVRTGEKARQLTPAGWNVNSPSLSADGKTVYFLSAKNGSMQLYSMPLGGDTPAQLTDFALDVDGYKVSPDGKQVAIAAAVFTDCGNDLACTKKKLDARQAEKTSGVTPPSCATGTLGPMAATTASSWPRSEARASSPRRRRLAQS